MAHPFFLFEGVDHTGKSTIAARIAGKFRGYLLEAPPQEVIGLRKPHDENDSPEENLDYYLAGNVINDRRVAVLREKKPVVLVRHFPSTVAHHSSFVGRNLDYILQYMLVKPDRTYHLTADISKVIVRMNRTGNINQRFGTHGVLREVRGHYERIFRGDDSVMSVDTSNVGLEDVSGIVLDDVAGFF